MSYEIIYMDMLTSSRVARMIITIIFIIRLMYYQPNDENNSKVGSSIHTPKYHQLKIVSIYLLFR